MRLSDSSQVLAHGNHCGYDSVLLVAGGSIFDAVGELQTYANRRNPSTPRPRYADVNQEMASPSDAGTLNLRLMISREC
jgi:hypothetical protein